MAGHHNGVKTTTPTQHQANPRSTIAIYPAKMTNQEGTMTQREIIDKMEAMAEKIQEQGELLNIMAGEKEDVEREVEVLHEELLVATITRKGKRKLKDVDVQAKKIVAKLMIKIYRRFKFTQKQHLLKWTPRDNGSYCGRVKDEFEKAKLQFNKLVFKAVCEITVEWQVKQRARYVTHVREASFGEYTADKVWHMWQTSDSLLSLWSAMRDTTGSFDFVKILTSKPAEESEEEVQVRHDLEAEFFALALIKIYGRKECEKWCADNKGKRLHQLITTSDRAYTKLLLEDRGAVYEEEHNLMSSLEGKDIELYKQFKRSGKCVDPEDKKR